MVTVERPLSRRPNESPEGFLKRIGVREWRPLYEWLDIYSIEIEVSVLNRVTSKFARLPVREFLSQGTIEPDSL